jgi:hypothetical protein
VIGPFFSSSQRLLSFHDASHHDVAAKDEGGFCLC